MATDITKAAEYFERCANVEKASERMSEMRHGWNCARLLGPLGEGNPFILNTACGPYVVFVILLLLRKAITLY